MRILQVHNKYQLPGGEDAVVQSDYDLLIKRGHVVEQLIVENLDGKKAQMAIGLLHNEAAAKQLDQVVNRFKPDVVHVHNVWYALGPSLFQALHRMGIPTVHTLHNFRNVCLNGLLARDGQVCMDCFNKPVAWSGIQHGCNKGSKATSAVVAASLAWHRRMGSFALPKRVICLTDYNRELMLNAGLGYRAEQVVVKPNHVAPMPTHRPYTEAPFLLFAGRLAPEKGVHLLKPLAMAGVPIKVAGDGPMMQEMKKWEAEWPNMELLGWQNSGQMENLMRRASALMLTSTWLEGAFPLVAIQALASGLPIIANDIPNFSQNLEEGKTGWVVNCHDEVAFVSAAKYALANPDFEPMSKACVAAYETTYHPQVVMQQLEHIYQQAIHAR